MTTSNELMRRYSIDEDYSSLIGEGGQWYRAADIDALNTAHDKLVGELREQVASRDTRIEQLERILKVARGVEDLLRRDIDALYARNKNGTTP